MAASLIYEIKRMPNVALGTNHHQRRAPLISALGIRMRERVRSELLAIQPFDSLEAEHLKDAIAWVDSGAPIFRISKPAVPPKHLVSYFAIIDGGNVLLVDHKNAQLWLPSGGHVEQDEDPRVTVVRELKEELGLDVPLEAISAPAMVTVTETVGLTAGHFDVSLWYVVRGSREASIAFDQHEFNEVRWFPFAAVPCERIEPHLHRFLAKVAQADAQHVVQPEPTLHAPLAS